MTCGQQFKNRHVGLCDCSRVCITTVICDRIISLICSCHECLSLLSISNDQETLPTGNNENDRNAVITLKFSLGFISTISWIKNHAVLVFLVRLKCTYLMWSKASTIFFGILFHEVSQNSHKKGLISRVP